MPKVISEVLPNPHQGAEVILEAQEENEEESHQGGSREPSLVLFYASRQKKLAFTIGLSNF